MRFARAMRKGMFLANKNISTLRQQFSITPPANTLIPDFYCIFCGKEPTSPQTTAKPRFFDNSKSVHNILDAAFRRLWQGRGLCRKALKKCKRRKI
jgi:hypothetical protein